MFALGGRCDDQWLASVEEYVVAENKWTPRASMGAARAQFGSVSLQDGEFIYVFGGFSMAGSKLVEKSIERYAVKTDAWEEIKCDREVLAASLVAKEDEDTVLILGGSSGGEMSTKFSVFKASTGTMEEGGADAPFVYAQAPCAVMEKNFVLLSDYGTLCYNRNM